MGTEKFNLSKKLDVRWTEIIWHVLRENMLSGWYCTNNIVEVWKIKNVRRLKKILDPLSERIGYPWDKNIKKGQRGATHGEIKNIQMKGYKILKKSIKNLKKSGITVPSR